MKLPNGYGTVKKMSGKRRRPYVVKKTVGWHYDEVKDKMIQDQMTIGYAATRAEGLQMLAEYNNNPFDLKASKVTFQEVYERWSKEKFPTISHSNVKGYEASYKVCGSLNNKVFRDMKLVDLQTVVDTCGKNYPTLKKLKSLFSQLYEYAMKNDICSKDYSEFVDIVKYKDKNPDKRDHNKFTKEENFKDEILSIMDNYNHILVFSYDAYCDSVQKDTINELLKTDKEVHVVSIKGPIDMQYFNGLKNYSCLYEYTPNSIKTIIKQLKNEIKLTGKLPL